MLADYISTRRQMLRMFASRIGKTAVIYPAAFLMASGLGMVLLGIIFFGNEMLGATPSQIGCLGATYLLSYVIGCLFLRPLSSRLLPRHSMLLAAALLALIFAAMSMQDSLALVFVLHGLAGLSASFFWPPLMAWLSADTEGGALNRSIGRFNLCWSGGLIASPVLAGKLSEVDPRLPLIAGACLFAVTAFLILGAILTLSGLAHDDAAHAEEHNTRMEHDGGGTFLRFPSWVGLFSAYVVTGVILNVFPLSGQRDLAMSKSLVGLFLLGRALANAITLGGMGRTQSWHFRGGQLVVGMLLFALTATLLVFAKSVVFVGLLVLLIGVFMAQSYANSLFHGLSGSQQRTRRMAIHESLLAAGSVCGAAFGGFIYQRLGMAYVYGFCSLVLLATAAIQAGLLAWARRKGQPLAIVQAG